MDFTLQLLHWYSLHFRVLPWKSTDGQPDPYATWVSEIILQQTRVAQGLAYYQRFLHTFPTVLDLAQAREDQVLKVWQGLGYYSRARNMHAAAQQIRDTYHGQFPNNIADLLTLKGVGPYTAAAIGSFAFNLPVAALDGNGYRILSRFFGIDLPPQTQAGKRCFENLAQTLLPPQQSASFNQALMDFGSLVCLPQPKCDECPLQEACVAYTRHQVAAYPVVLPKKQSKNRYFNYLCFLFDDYTYLQQRQSNDIWKGLYEFPLLESPTSLDTEEVLAHPLFQSWMQGIPYTLVDVHPLPVHKLSHQNIYAVFYTFRLEHGLTKAPDSYLVIPAASCDNYAVSRLTERYLNFLITFVGS